MSVPLDLNIFTTTGPNENNTEYTTLSGTSYSSPYIAGGAALLLQLQQQISAKSAAAAAAVGGDEVLAAAASRRNSRNGGRSNTKSPSSSSSSSLAAMQKIWNSALVNNIHQRAFIDAMISTATPLNSDSESKSDLPTAVSKLGAGLVDLAAAYYNPI